LLLVVVVVLVVLLVLVLPCRRQYSLVVDRSSSPSISNRYSDGVDRFVFFYYISRHR